MIDLHCHILWNMDDGASSMEKTVQMCQTAVKNKIQIIAATPHMTDLRTVDDFLYIRNQKLTELNRFLRAENLPLQVCGGAEVFLNELVFETENLEELTLNRSRYLLCEYSLQPFNPDKAILLAEEILERGLVPIIAHPERYPTFHKYPDMVLELHRLGARFQVNGDSLTGKLGEAVCNFGTEMLMHGLADCIATDAHGVTHRKNDFCAMQSMFPAGVTTEIVRYTTETVPLCVLKNEPLPRNPSLQSRTV
ncbi:MAG: tyrosine-protein phosphatase [Candidatus Fimenecus sp.]